MGRILPAFQRARKGLKYMKVTTDSAVARALSTKGGSFKEKYESRINGKQRAHSRPTRGRTLH